MPTLTKRAVDAADPEDKETFLWCARTPGFGVRIHPSGKKVFVSQLRLGRKQIRKTIGLYGPFTVEQARAIAERQARAIATGVDPREAERPGISMSELCQEYLEAARAGLVFTRFKRPKRRSTVTIDEGRVARHIEPTIGKLAAAKVTRADVQRMADAIARGNTAGTFKGPRKGTAVVIGGTGAATRVVELLGGIFTWAERRGLVSGINPVVGVEKLKGEPKDRVLTGSELKRLGTTLAAHEAKAPMAVGASRLIALTGFRREEACGLAWREIDEVGRCARLEDTKSGRSMRPLGRAALDLLRGLPRVSDNWVFPSRNNERGADLKRAIADIFDAAGLRDARSHDLRRTFASVAADEGYSDATIGELLGHARRGVTSRHYIRRPDAALVAAADRVSSYVAALLDGEARGNIVSLHQVGGSIGRSN